jgi:hypothetical protein
MQVINFHPGMIYTSELERDGIPEHGVFDFDDREYTFSLVGRSSTKDEQRTCLALLPFGLRRQKRSTCTDAMCIRRGMWMS